MRAGRGRVSCAACYPVPHLSQVVPDRLVTRRLRDRESDLHAAVAAFALHHLASEQQRLVLREGVERADLDSEALAPAAKLGHGMCRDRGFAGLGELPAAGDIGHEAVEVRLEM